MLEHRVFLTSGFGNNLFQLVEFYGQDNFKVIGRLQSSNLLTRLIGFKVFHDYIPRFETLKYHHCSLLDVVILLLLYFRWCFSMVDQVKIQVFNKVWHYGYFQNNYVFKGDHSCFLKTICKLADQEPVENAACVHVRRGDFEENCLSLNYYVAALKYMYEVKRVKNFHFIGIGAVDLVSELRDTDATSYNIEVLPLLDERTDFDLMRKYVHQIGSNSTFNFWAVVLGNAKSVVFPDELSANLHSIRCMDLNVRDIRFF